MSRRAKTRAPTSPVRHPPGPDILSAGGTLWPMAAIVAAGIGTYANALAHPFLFDDGGAIVDNPTIRTLAGSIWGGPAQLPTAGRPLVNLTFAVNYLAGGLSPVGYHAVNLALHVSCALLLFALLRRLFTMPAAGSLRAGPGVALAVALLWVVHPLTSEIVNYATQRTEAMMALAFLATLYCSVRAFEVERPVGWYVAAVAACAAGMACKESMAAAPLVLLLLDAAFTGSGIGAAFRRRRGFYLALFATWLLLALLIVEGPRWRSAGFSSGVSPWTYLLNQAQMIVRYLRLVAWPTGLVLDYGEPQALTLSVVWPAAAFVVALLCGGLAAWRIAPVAAFFALWFFLSLAPSSSLFPIATEVGAERRMYLPLVGVLTLVALAAARALTRVENEQVRKTSARAAVAGACVLLALATIARNREYATPLGLWQTVVERWPSGRGFYNLGVELQAAGRQDAAVDAYRQALPGAPEAHYALGFELHQQGKFDEALEQYRTFIRLRPDDLNVPRTYHQIGRTLLAQGKKDDAIVAFREVLARKAGDVDALGGLADTLLAQDRLTEAVTAYREYLRIKPNTVDPMMNLGLALVRLDRDEEARDVFQAVTELQPSDVGARVNYAYALANTGRYGESVTAFRKAAELETNPTARAEIDAAIAELLGSH